MFYTLPYKLSKHFYTLNSKMNKAIQLALVIVFLTTIYLPNSAMFAGLETFIYSAASKTEPTTPRINWSRLDLAKDVILEFYNQNFGFRGILIQKKDELSRRFFKSVRQRNVLLGKQGLYYFNPIDPKDPKKDYKTVFFTETELKDIKEELEKEYGWFRDRSIPYFVVIGPDKEAIYPELYPYPTILTNLRLDQLIDYLNKNSNVRLVDLRAKLIKEKRPDRLLYFVGDTHWNQIGSFFGYQEVMHRLQEVKPEVVVPNLADFDVLDKDDKTITGDLVRIAKLVQDPYRTGVRLVPKPNLLAKPKLKKVFIYGDSFTRRAIGGEISGLSIFLPFSFEEVKVSEYTSEAEASKGSKNPLDLQVIEEKKPDLVVRETTQRNLRILLGPQYDTL